MNTARNNAYFVHEHHTVSGLLYTRDPHCIWPTLYTSLTLYLAYSVHEPHTVSGLLYTRASHCIWRTLYTSLTLYLACSVHEPHTVSGLLYTRASPCIWPTLYTSLPLYLAYSVHEPHTVSGLLYTRASHCIWPTLYTSLTLYLAYMSLEYSVDLVLTNLQLARIMCTIHYLGIECIRASSELRAFRYLVHKIHRRFFECLLREWSYTYLNICIYS